MPTWLKTTLNLLLAVILIVLSVVFTIYSDAFDKSKKYTYGDLQDAYNTGYEKASSVVADLQTKIYELEKANITKEQQIFDLQKELQDLQELNSALEIDNQNKQLQIVELQNDIEQKNAEIANLQAEIQRLKTELEIYSNQEIEYFYITFYVDNEVYKTMSVRQGGSVLIDVENPTKYGYVFECWTDGENEIDLTTYEFTEDKNLYAQFSQFKAQINVNLSYAFERTEPIANSMLNIYDTSTGERIYYQQLIDCSSFEDLNPDQLNDEEVFWFVESGTLQFELPCGDYVFEIATLKDYSFTCEYDVLDFVVDGSNDVITINAEFVQK